jgi:hypothetical protein
MHHPRLGPARPALASVMLACAAPACSDNLTAAQGDDVTTTAPSGQVVEVDTLDELIAAAAGQAGEIVDDTEIRYVDGSDTISIGGLDVVWPLLGERRYSTAAGNFTVPPSWPTLDLVQLDSEGESFENPVIGVGVFAQTTLVSEPDSRQRMFDEAWRVARHTDSDVIHRSETVSLSTGVTCWAEIRHGQVGERPNPRHHAVVLIAGEGIASSGIVIWAASSYTELPADTGALVEAVCGARPGGL